MSEKASFLVWCEWLCTRCQEQHRIRFSVIVEGSGAYRLTRPTFKQNGLIVLDVAYRKGKREASKKTALGGSRIYVKYDTTNEDIFQALKSYMQQFYAIRNGSLKMEVCFSEP